MVLLSATVGDLVFPVSVSGPEDGVPIVLLHGWPQDYQCFDKVVPGLNKAGYRTYAPTLRGNAESCCPQKVRDYAMSRIGQDVIDIMDSLGLEKAHLVCHDWGSITGWLAACINPERILSLFACSAPHPGAIVLSFPLGVQFLKSSYSFPHFFGHISEFVFTRTTILKQLLQIYGQKPENAQRDTLRIYKNYPLARGGTNYYRALPYSLFKEPRFLGKKTSVPVTQVWSDKDLAVSHRCMSITRRFATGPYQFNIVRGVSHWVPEVAPQEFLSLAIEHLKKYDNKSNTANAS